MLSKTLSRRWFQWLRTPAPTANFRAGKNNALTYGLEHDIDHEVSYIQSLVRSAIAGEPLDYPRLAGNELKEVQEMSLKLEACELPDSERAKYSDFLQDMLALLDELKNHVPEPRKH